MTINYEVHCFLCREDITNKNKIISHSFDNGDYSYSDRNAEKLNYALCSKCADKDFKLRCDLVDIENKKYKQQELDYYKTRSLIDRIRNRPFVVGKRNAFYP